MQVQANASEYHFSYYLIRLNEPAYPPPAPKIIKQRHFTFKVLSCFPPIPDLTGVKANTGDLVHRKDLNRFTEFAVPAYIDFIRLKLGACHFKDPVDV